VHGRSFKKRAPWALKSVKEFATKHMGTKDVRVDPKLNQAIWGQGIKNVPKRLRIRLERKRNDEEGAKERLYTLATVVPGVTDFKVRLSCTPGLPRASLARLLTDRLRSLRPSVPSGPPDRRR
jgi:large subunit ribosomal protein L31e